MRMPGLYEGCSKCLGNKLNTTWVTNVRNGRQVILQCFDDTL